MRMKHILILMAIYCTLIFIGEVSASEMNRTYTYDSDFELGTLTGLEHNSTPNQLQLSDNSQSTFPYIWVPNSNQGTVSKIDTQTGLELARYRTAPESYGTSASPSRTTIDLYGACWVGNRGIGTVVKIGLLENEGYYDRNQNGLIETSRDFDGNGVITEAELLDWGKDECILWEVIVIPSIEGTYRPGEYAGSYSGSPGPRGIAVDHNNNVWVGTYGTCRYYYINGTTGEILDNIDITSSGHTPYGALIDPNGILWSSGSNSNHLLRLDPTTNTFTRINLGHCSYGMGLDRNDHLFVSGGQHSWLTRINIINGTIDWKKPATPASGVTVTDDGDVWLANHDAGTVTRYTNNGDFKAIIIVGSTPKGVSVDNNGKVWVVDNGDEYIHRINPNNNQTNSEGYITNGVEFSKRILGGTHYGYSDMTGSVSSTVTTTRGIWTVIHDSGQANIPWGIVNWTGTEPTGTSIGVRVRSSQDQQNWSNWEETINGAILTNTPAARYLQVETTLNRFLGNQTPTLYDLTVTALVADVQLNLNADKPSPQVGEEVTFTLNTNNQGPQDVTRLTVNVNIPPGFRVGTVSQGTFQNGVWDIGTLTNGQKAVLTIVGWVNPTQSHQIVTCNALKTYQDHYDPNTPDNATASFYLPLTDLEITANVNNNVMDVGEQAIFTTTISNNGPDPARNLRMEKKLLTGFKNLSPSLGTYQNGMWIVPFLSSGANATLTFIGEVTQDMAHKTITDSTRLIQQEYDPTPVTSVNSSFYVPLVDLEITKIAHRDPVVVGGVALFTITVRNLGPDTARGVVVRDPLPDGFVPANPSQGILINGWWLVGDLVSGKSAIIILGSPVVSKLSMTSYAAGFLRSYDPNLLNNQPVLTINAQERATVFQADKDPVNVNAETEKTIPMQETGLPLNLPSLALFLIFLAAYLNRNGTPYKKPLILILVLVAVFLCCGVVSAADSYNYTNNDDFDQGILGGVEHNTVHHQLQLPPEAEEVDYIWVPNSNQGTVSKVSTHTGAEVARYRVNPRSDEFTFTTIVDNEGNCWAANSRSGSVVKIGLLENYKCTDRNHNGIIDTSHDLDHNGVITGAELLAWGQDECVLFETILVPGSEGTYTPGSYTGSYGNYDYGVRSMAVDLDNNLWAGNYNTRLYYYINSANGQIIHSLDLAGVNHNPYVSVMDRNGILWSAGNNLLRLDPSTDSKAIINLGYLVNSLVLDQDVHLFSYGYNTGWNRNSMLSRINITTGVLDWTQTLPFSDVAGVTVTPDGDVWISESASGWGWRRDYVKRFGHDGVLKATIEPGFHPNGLSVDSDGKVWVVDYDDEYIHRINPTINGVELSKRIVGGRHYTSSSMTGTSSTANYFQEGSWTVVQDTGKNSTLWGFIDWTSSEPNGTMIRVRARSSNDENYWSIWEEATNGHLLHLTPPGRYLQVEVTLSSTVKDISPSLYDLTVTPLEDAPINHADLSLTILSENYTPNVNDTIKIILYAGNNGVDDASGVHVNYKLPFGLEYQNSSSKYNASTGLWTIGSVARGTTTVLEILAKVLNSGLLVHTGTITGTEVDPNMSNNQSTLILRVSNLTAKEQLPELPNILPINGAATLPPIPNIIELIDLNPNIQESGPKAGFNPYQKPNNQSNSQIARDIASVRDIISNKDILEQKVLPSWDLNTDGSQDVSKENDKWKSFLVKFAGEVIFFAALSSIPNEYLQQVGNSFLKSFETLSNILRYLGFGKQVKQIAGLWERAKHFINIPFTQDIISKLDDLLNVLDFSLGMTLLERTLIKIFPNTATEIKLLMTTISTANLTYDGGKTIKAIFSIIYSILTKSIPRPDDLIKLL